MIRNAMFSHTGTQLTYIANHKMQECDSVLTVWQKLKNAGHDKIRKWNLRRLALWKLFLNTPEWYFYTSASWFGVWGCIFTGINHKGESVLLRVERHCYLSSIKGLFALDWKDLAVNLYFLKWKKSHLFCHILKKVLDETYLLNMSPSEM